MFLSYRFVGSAKEQCFLELGGEGGVGVVDFGEETVDCGAEGPGEFGRVEVADEGVGEGIGYCGGQMVEAPTVMGGEVVAKAGEGEGGIAESADHEFGLPEVVSSNGCAGVEGVEPGEADERVGVGRWSVKGVLGFAGD